MYKTASPPELTRKHVASMFFTRELENEVRDAGRNPDKMCWTFTKNNDTEKYMDNVVSQQMFTTYDQ